MQRYKTIKAKTFNQNFGSPSKKEYPTFSLTLDNIPEAKNWEIGGKYQLNLKVKLSGLNQDEGSTGRATFAILGINTAQNKKTQKRKKRVSRY